MKKMKRLFSLLLVFALVVGLMPGTVFVSAATTQFTDTKASAFYSEAVEWAVEEGVTNGTTATTFGPEEACTRAQIVTFLWRAAGKPEAQTTKSSFNDISKSGFYYKAVLWAVENGITTGTSDNTFSPDMVCTRGQVVTFLYRFSGEPSLEDTNNPFTDLKPSGFYYRAVLWAVQNGITNGMSPTTFAPGNDCTRGQIVTFLYRAVNDTETPEPEELVITSQPKSAAIDEGKTTTLKVSVSGGTQPYTYQWKKDNKNISGATSASYKAGEAGKYTCVVTDADGNTVTSSAATVTSNEPEVEDLIVTTQPKSAEIELGKSTTLSVSVSGGIAPYSYQWKVGNAVISGATSSSYTTKEAGSYTCVITDAQGTTVKSNTAVVTLSVPDDAALTVTKQPAGGEITSIGVRLEVAADGGTSPYTYQWYKDGVVISGATAYIYIANQPGYYHCTIQDSAGAKVFSNYVAVTVAIATYSITYDLYGNDEYLQKIGVENTNPDSYSSDSGLKLSSITAKGYDFVGWFDGAGANATQIKEIKAGETGDMELYAHWEKIEYTVTFDSPDIPVSSVTYTVDKGITLTNPSWFGYTFVGWSTDGKIVSSIEPGTTGNITLHANWTSNRNKAKAVTKLEDPSVIEDVASGKYLFVYEIGTIENVPLAEIEYIGNSQGINIDSTYEYTKAVQEGYADTIANTVSNATTKTSAWTLSEDWNSSTSATNEHDEEIGKTESKTDSEGTVVGSKYYVSNSAGGTTATSSSGGGSISSSSKVTEGTSTGINGSYTTEHQDTTSVDLSVSKTKTKESNWNVSGNIGYTPASSTGGWGGGVSGGFGGSSSSSTTGSVSVEQVETDKTSATIAASRTHNVGTESSLGGEINWDTSSSSTSNWNSESSYEASAETSRNTEISNTISSVINDRYSYTSMESRGGENSTTSSTGESQELTDEYTSTVEYSVEEQSTVSKTITYYSDATGYYRLVTAGTVHVFAVVGYDIATNSYFTYTYNVLDKERHEYLDYSKDNANFNDCENAVLPFEIPYFVHEYVSTSISRSEGLTVDYDTGLITEYYGDASYVVIPEYISVKNVDGTYSAIKIRGFEKDVFKGNTNIKGIVLPKYVTKIPDNAFDGCSSLELVIGYGITEIGNNAFRDCTSLGAFTLDEKITALGVNAFENAPEISVTASSASVAEAAINSGAKKITLNISHMEDSLDNKMIFIPEGTEYFALNSNGTTYENLQIESNATETSISNMTFVNNVDTPLILNSEVVTLSRVTVEKSQGFALILSEENTDLKLFGTISLSSANENTVISKDVTFSKANEGVSGKMNVTGNYLVCGTLTNDKMLNVTDGSVKNITESEFESYLESIIVYFDANEGTVEEASKTGYYGQKYGTLPTPTREYHDFLGWFTAKAGGTQITEDTIVTARANQTLYAQWDRNTFEMTFDANEGTVETESSMIPCGQAVGELPVPTRDYYTFAGWFTSKEGGEQITAETVITAAEDMTVYAQWTLNETSDWVLASEMPEDAQVVDQKWTYKLTTTTESKATSLSGYTQTGSYWVQSGSGSVNYATFPSGFDTSHSIYTSFSKSALTASETTTTKRTVSNSWAGYVYWHWMYNTNSANGTQYRAIYHKYGTGPDNGFVYKYFGAFTSTNGSYSSDTGYCNSQNIRNYIIPERTAYADCQGATRWFRFDYYKSSYVDYYKMFQYKKVEDKESSTKVTASSTISDVQEWVQYREK